jgi:predicted nucleic acid binding AN1-type Zn finger protein
MVKKSCYFCNNKLNKIFMRQCNYCNQIFCLSHNAPDIHNCIENENYIENKKEEFIKNQEKLVYEKHKINKI